MIDMRPKSFLIEHLERSMIVLDTLEYSFIFELIHATGRVDHFTSYFESSKGCVKESRLETRDIFYIFDVPMLYGVRTFVESAFSTTWGIEKNPVE
jgi:hypothetical protein